MNGINKYFKDSFKELRNEVTWPTWTELQKTTIIVVLGSVFLALLVATMDVSLGNVVGLLYKQ